jgi:hypothetical protein
VNQACELCEAAKLTEWFFDDDVCWIAECESCSVPMVVWRVHGAEPSEEIKSLLWERLLTVTAAAYGFDPYIDDRLRSIPDHYHAHARPRGGFTGNGQFR